VNVATLFHTRPVVNDSVRQCRHLLTVAEPLLQDLDDSHRAIGLDAGTKTAGWLVGHLAVTGDFGRKLCGRPPLCPEYPPMAALCERFRAVYTDLCEAALQADAPLLARENPFAPGRASFATAGDFVTYLLAGHLGYHLGQLSGWRAAVNAKA
jgi:hypothetical protein